MTLPLLLSVLLACQSLSEEAQADALAATASAEPTCAKVSDTTEAWPSRVPDGLALVALDSAPEGVAQATAALGVVRAGLETLGPIHRATAQAAAKSIITNCPYNRSAVQLPLVMHQVLAEQGSPELAAVKAGVAEHLAVLQLLGVAELPAPELGDYLFGASEHLYTARQLAKSDDPVAHTQALLTEVLPLVQAYDDATLTKLDAARAVLKPATQDQWPFKDELVGFKVALDEVAATTKDAAVRADAEALAGLIEALMSNSC